MSAARSLLHCCFARRTTGLLPRSGAVRAGGARPYGPGARAGHRAPPAAAGRKPPVTRMFPQTVSRVGERSEPGTGAPAPTTESNSAGHRATGAPATCTHEPLENPRSGPPGTPGTAPGNSRDGTLGNPGNPPGRTPRDSPEGRPFPAMPDGSAPCATGAEPHVTGLFGPASRPPPALPPDHRRPCTHPLATPWPPPRRPGSGPRAVPLPVPRVTLSRRLALYRIEGRHRLFANDGRGLSCGGGGPGRPRVLSPVSYRVRSRIRSLTPGPPAP